MIDILTPNSILCSEVEHSKPFIIFPEDFKSFEDLLKVKDLIRDLKLVPIKSDEMQLYYHSFTKEELLKTIQFKDSNFLFIKNSFPYMLPEDVEQYVIWIKQDTKQEQVINFIEEKCLALNTKDIILFERPFGIKTKLVKPSFPFIRHIHFWHKKL